MTEQKLTAGDMSGYKCGYCGCWHTYSSEMCKDAMKKSQLYLQLFSCGQCAAKDLEIATLKRKLQELNDYIEGCLV